MGERTTVEPDYASAGWESSSPFLGEKTRAEYPLHLGPHRVKVRYTFENQNGGWNKVAMRYFCERCDTEGYIEHDRLHEAEGEHMQAARLYILGLIIEKGCV